MLRRRLAKDDVPTDSSASSTPSPAPEPDHKKYVPKPRSKRRNGLIFLLGGIFGICVALFFANQQEVISLDSLMDLNLDSLIDVIPQGVVKDAREFSVRLPKSNLPSLGSRADCCSNTSVIPSATTPSLSACSSRRKASRPSILS